MRWEDERYVRLYTRDTVDWHFLSFEAQGLLCLLLRKVDRAGILELGRYGRRGVAAAIGHSARHAEIDKALDELLADGCVRITDDGARLLIKNFVEAQEAKASDKARQQKARELARDLAAAQAAGVVTPRDAAVTPCDETSRENTGRHAESQAVTPNQPSRAVPSRAEPAEPRRAAPPSASLPAAGRPPLRDEMDAVFLEAAGVPYEWTRADEDAVRGLLGKTGGRDEILRRWRIAQGTRFPKCTGVACLLQHWNAYSREDTGPPRADVTRGIARVSNGENRVVDDEGTVEW